MGSGFRKKKGKNEFEYYKPSKEDWEAYRYCVKNNIRISFKPLEQGMSPKNFKLTVCLGPYQKYEKPNLSPQTYGKDEIVEQMYKAMKYYYDKHTRRV